MGGDKLLPAIAQISERSERGQAISKRKKEIFNGVLGSLQPTRGARAFLEHLRRQNITLAIATSADEKELGALLAQAGLEDLFPSRTSKDDAEESKPDPDIVHAALVKAGASPEEAVLIGDTPYDIQAATQAAVRSIALRCGGYWSDEALKGAIGLYDDPQDLFDHVR
jgi:HAD superfamily hydrolase (TIGR01509 family)